MKPLIEQAIERTQPAPSGHGAFQWPPKADVPAAQPVSRPIEIRLPHPFVESVETELLGRTGIAFDRWAQQTGWVRDRADRYCWRCAGSIGAHETDGEGCATCRTISLPWDRAIRLSKYQKTIRQEVLMLKFGAWRPTGRGLGMHLGLAIKDQLSTAQIPADQVVLVPIPMHWRRRMIRGIDHTLILARAAARSSGCRVDQLLHARLRNEQVGLSKTARARNMKNAFFLTKFDRGRVKKSMAQNRRLFIMIDDVRTTGATFVSASKALKTAFSDEFGGNSMQGQGAEIWTACVGVAGETRREVGESEG
tara:strand:- start:390 stop:1313 length:924 start_codon:yes stop_codon:yes gene_type:complete